MEKHREEELKNKFNNVIKKILDSKIDDNVDDDFYGKITFEGLVELKKAISHINNIITLKVTEAFIDKLENDGFILPSQAENMKENVKKISANANGYDVRYDDGKILAEVKCNIPVNINEFGSKQVEGIIKDIDGLLSENGKTKDQVQTKEYYKFMVFLNAEGVKDSVKKLFNSDKLKSYKNNLVYYNQDGSHIKKEDMITDNAVYIVFI